jgi:hypothetical protein
MNRLLLCAGLLPICLWAQEVDSGFELRGTATVGAFYSQQLSDAPRSGSPVDAGFRTVLYPTWKLSRKWSLTGAVQIYSRPYFFEQFSTQGRGIKADLLQAQLTYSQYWHDRSVVIGLGQLSSAFGSFSLRYDDAANPLIDMPASYGYYYKPVTTLGLAGAQIDTTWKRLDARAQFVNSSPANRRSVSDRDQYGNWAGGLGWTIVQGLRAGASAYYGPYLHRDYEYYFPGEANPRDLPARAFGIDAQWSRGHWNANGEWQWFRFSYDAIPTFRQENRYVEVRRVLHPRWYIAGRAASMTNLLPGTRLWEGVVGFRPNGHQLIKAGFEVPSGSGAENTHPTFAIQVVTTFRALSISRD